MSLSYINFRISLTIPALCPWVTCTQTHTRTHYPACGEERKDKLHPNICFAYLPWPAWMCIFEELWARGIHQCISTVVTLSVETLPDVIQISTFLRLEGSLTIRPELCLSKWFKSQEICFIQISSSIVCSILNGPHIIRDREISCSRYRKAILLYVNATVVSKCVCNACSSNESFVTVLNTKQVFWALWLDIQL